MSRPSTAGLGRPNWLRAIIGGWLLLGCLPGSPAIVGRLQLPRAGAPNRLWSPDGLGSVIRGRLLLLPGGSRLGTVVRGLLLSRGTDRLWTVTRLPRSAPRDRLGSPDWSRPSDGLRAADGLGATNGLGPNRSGSRWRSIRGLTRRRRSNGLRAADWARRLWSRNAAALRLNPIAVALLLSSVAALLLILCRRNRRRRRITVLRLALRLPRRVVAVGAINRRLLLLLARSTDWLGPGARLRPIR